LLAMVGLEAVKSQALSIFLSVLGDKQLKQRGFGDAVSPSTLNFAFVGNPGTGKTTVAKIFSALLSACGVRNGHNFVEIKAHQALQMKPDKWAEVLETLTGSKVSSGPPPSIDRMGTQVEVEELQAAAAAPVHGQGTKKWYPGKIVNFGGGLVQPNGSVSPKTYIVKFADDTTEQDIEARRIRPIVPKCVCILSFLLC
jgi:DNA polymerase III delta prime subunit